MNRVETATFFLLLLGASWVVPVPVQAQAQSVEQDWAFTPRSAADLQRIQGRLQELLPSAKRATVAIVGDGSGSGVIISRDGLVLTAGHVCGEAGTELRVILADGNVVEAKSLGVIKFADAGLIRMEKGRYPHYEVASNGTAAALGTWCFALGHPGGWDRARGPVVRLGRVISRTKRTLRSDCKLVGGDSGGPLFDLRGRLIAVHSRISKGADQNFHVPMAAYLDRWADLLQGRVALVPASGDATVAAASGP